MTITRTTIIEYDAWDSNDAGTQLDGIHKLVNSAERFELEFTVIVSGSTTGQFTSRAQVMLDALDRRDGDVKITFGGVEHFYFFVTPQAAANLSSTRWNANSTEAFVETLDRGRTDRSCSYRIRIVVEKPADQQRPGIREEDLRVTTGVRGNREFTLTTEYTNDPNDSNYAYGVYSSGTYSFANRISAAQSFLTGTWEQVGPIEVDHEYANTATATRNLVASVTYREVLDSVTISYNGWSTADTGWSLWGAHGVTESTERFVCVFDAVVTADDDTAMVTRVEAMLDALQERDETLNIANGSDVYYNFDASGFTAEAAQSIIAEAQLLQNDRADLTRVYRITFEVNKIAQQSGKPGLRRETVVAEDYPEGNKFCTVSVEFTPYDEDNALTRFADATYGFVPRATALLAVVDAGTWERVGPIRQNYDREQRVLTAEAQYRKILYDQLQGETNSTSIVDVQYVVDQLDQTVQRAPGTTAAPFTEVTVSFTARIPTTADMGQVLRDQVVPYIRDTVSTVLLASGTPIVTRQRLQGNPVDRSVSGQIDMIVTTSDTLAAQVRFIEQGATGKVNAPVFDGTPWSRNKYQGPGSWFRTAQITGEFVGVADEGLDQLEQSVRDDFGPSWVLVEWGVESLPTERVFNGQSIKTTTQVRTLTFEYATVSGQVSSENNVLLPPGHEERQ